MSHRCSPAGAVEAAGRAQPSRSARPPQSSSGLCDGGTLDIVRILLIEDSQKLVDSLRLGLDDVGLRSGFGRGRRARAAHGAHAARGRSWSSTCMLPGLAGLEVLRRLREAGSDAHVLILTALGAVEDRVRGLQAGADDYLGKPFSLRRAPGARAGPDAAQVRLQDARASAIGRPRDRHGRAHASAGTARSSRSRTASTACSSSSPSRRARRSRAWRSRSTSTARAACR